MASAKNRFNITKTEWHRGSGQRCAKMNMVLLPRNSLLILNLYIFLVTKIIRRRLVIL